MTPTLAPTLAPLLSQPPTHIIAPQATTLAVALNPKATTLTLVSPPPDATLPPLSPPPATLLLHLPAPHTPRPRDLSQHLALSYTNAPPTDLIYLIVPFIPGTHRRGKKADRLRDAGHYINTFLRFHNPNHPRLFSLNQWHHDLTQNGFVIRKTHYYTPTYHFHQWASTQNLSPTNLIRLQALLVQAPQLAAEFLTPDQSGVKISFRLSQAIIIVHRTKS